NAGLIEGKPAHIGRASHANQQFVEGYPLFVPGAGDKCPFALYLVYFTVQSDVDTIARQNASEELCCLAILARQQLFDALHQTHLAAQADECLRQLASNRTAPQYEKPWGESGQFENVLVRPQIARVNSF